MSLARAAARLALAAGLVACRRPTPTSADAGSEPYLLPPPDNAPLIVPIPTAVQRSPASRGALTGDEIEAVVNAHKLALRRTCMERTGSTLPSSKTIVHVTIDDQGAVSGAVPEGNDPATGACLANEIKTWRFPHGPGQVAIPFSFVRQ